LERLRIGERNRSDHEHRSTQDGKDEANPSHMVSLASYGVRLSLRDW
jgi:hypothetical protein